MSTQAWIWRPTPGRRPSRRMLDERGTLDWIARPPYPDPDVTRSSLDARAGHCRAWAVVLYPCDTTAFLAGRTILGCSIAILVLARSGDALEAISHGFRLTRPGYSVRLDIRSANHPREKCSHISGSSGFCVGFVGAAVNPRRRQTVRNYRMSPICRAHRPGRVCRAHPFLINKPMGL